MPRLKTCADATVTINGKCVCLSRDIPELSFNPLALELDI